MYCIIHVGFILKEEINMRIRTHDTGYYGCGVNKKKYGGMMKTCKEFGLDINIYKLGPNRIKRLLKKRHNVDIDIENKTLIEITRQAQAVIYE